jgi:hypothetical protein
MVRPVGTAALVFLIITGCGRPPATSTSNQISSGDAHEDAVTAVITDALNAEASGQRSESLFAPSAVIVVNGRTRTLSPLFAGVAAGGQVVVTSSQLEIRNGISWGLVEYRWESRDGVTREGRATFVLTQTTAANWRIQHAHSSSPR